MAKINLAVSLFQSPEVRQVGKPITMPSILLKDMNPLFWAMEGHQMEKVDTHAPSTDAWAVPLELTGMYI